MCHEQLPDTYQLSDKDLAFPTPPGKAMFRAKRTVGYYFEKNFILFAHSVFNVSVEVKQNILISEHIISITNHVTLLNPKEKR